MKRRAAWIVNWSSVVLAGLLILVFLTGGFREERGGEFSPDTLQRRSYEGYRWGPWLLPKVRREPENTAVGQYLAANGYLEPVPSEVRWLSIGCRGGSVSSAYMGAGEGAPYLRYFEDDELVRWSDRHPEAARAFWPQIVAWTREERLPELQGAFFWFRCKPPATATEAAAILEKAQSRPL